MSALCFRLQNWRWLLVLVNWMLVLDSKVALVQKVARWRRFLVHILHGPPPNPLTCAFWHEVDHPASTLPFWREGNCVFFHSAAKVDLLLMRFCGSTVSYLCPHWPGAESSVLQKEGTT